MHRAARLGVTVIIVVAAIAAFAQAQKRSITEKDLFEFNWIGDPQVSPDGARVAFVKVSVDEKKTGYDTSIWVVSTKGDEPPRRMSDGKHDQSPRWSPDGKWLAFLRMPEVPATPSEGPNAGAEHRSTPQVYILPLSGGESWKVTDLPRGASDPEWSPDSKWIAFTSTTNRDDLARAAKHGQKHEENVGEKGTPEAGPAAAKPTPEPEHVSDVRVITRSVYRLNGVGYLDPKHPQHIWVVAAPQSSEDTVKPRQLTSGEFQENDIMWAHDSAHLYFATTKAEDPSYELPHADIYSVATDGGEPQKVLTINMAPRAMSLSPDGKRLAFCAAKNQPVQSYTEPDLWVVDLAPNAAPRNLTANFDFDVCSGPFGDQETPRAGGRNDIIWSHDGRSLFTNTGEQGRGNLMQFDVATGKVTPVTNGNQDVDHYRATADGSKFVVQISTPTTIGDLFWVDAPGAQPRQLTHVNQKLFSQLNLTEPEEFWYTSFDGKKIQAWIQKPPDFDPAKKYPLVLDIHGGPHAAYGWVFEHEFQWMAAKGYVVLYPNPRGSTSYGQDFGNVIQYHYPGDDYRDLMAGVDEVLKKGYVDPKKLGVTGGSGGGLLTNWVIGHTDRFAAAVSQRDIASWAAWWYIADFTLFQPSWFKAPPFDDPQDYVNRSPITYIKNVHTPLMLILGDADYRTPPASGGEEMFRALKFLHRPVIMVRFPGESHELSRSGQPWHRVERLEHIVGWFDKYLQGKSRPEYDDLGPTEVGVPPGELPGKPPQPGEQKRPPKHR